MEVIDGNLESAPLTIADRLQRIDELARELYAANMMFTPSYPYVFVLVCVKAQKVGHLYVPEKQNKPVHEGIVLATWREKRIEKQTKTEKGILHTYYETRRSDMQAGDHVLFQHSAGQPIHGYDTDRFRVVKERDWTLQGDGGGIFMRVDISDAPKPVEQLLEMLQNKHGQYGYVKGTTGEIEDRFVVVDREAQSVTLSGV